MENVILDQAMQLYDNASNGNRTRGSMKKAQDLYVHQMDVLFSHIPDQKIESPTARVSFLKVPNSRKLWR